MKIDDELANRFVCQKCGGSGARAKRIAATGTGFSKLFDIQHNKFIALSCHRCGFTELYNLEALEASGHLSDILDLLFGG